MKAELYRWIVNELQTSDDVDRLSKSLPDVSYNTLRSIHAQRYQKMIRATYHEHKKPESILKYVQRYNAGASMVEIAEENSIAPCLLARLLLSHMLVASKQDISKYFRDPKLIPDKRLQREIEECIEMDEHYSPLIDKIKHSIGLEYEYILQEKLYNLGVPFKTEKDLREEGYPKTPDVKLLVPLAVGNHIVNWIDSKACFGDEYVHMANVEQFRSYVNRYGSGMVIYWFDFVDSLQNMALSSDPISITSGSGGGSLSGGINSSNAGIINNNINNSGVLIVNDFPADFLMLFPSPPPPQQQQQQQQQLMPSPAAPILWNDLIGVE